MKRLAFLAALFAVAYISAAAAAFIQDAVIDAMQEPGSALCETDSECMLHCPPPADDQDCDGGPQ
jgi:hypothetical protein